MKLKSLSARRRDRQTERQKALYRRGFGEVVAQIELEGVNQDDEVALLKAAVGAGTTPTDDGFWSVIEGAMHGIRHMRSQGGEM